MNLPLLILAHARSGSTALRDCFDRHDSCSICNEPFNPTRRTDGWGYDFLGEFKTTKDLPAILDRIALQYDGAKHLVGQLGVEHTAMIARYFPSVIWMIRRNRLRAVVSALIAEQTLVWHLREESQELSDKLQPISLDRVAEFLANQERNIENAEQIIESEQLPVIRLVYEDLFDPEKSLHSRVEEIYKLVGNFVDVETDPKFRFKIAERLDQATNKVSTSNTYRRIPNIQEIEGAFGCEKNGSLF